MGTRFARFTSQDLHLLSVQKVARHGSSLHLGSLEGGAVVSVRRRRGRGSGSRRRTGPVDSVRVTDSSSVGARCTVAGSRVLTAGAAYSVRTCTFCQMCPGIAVRSRPPESCPGAPPPVDTKGFCPNTPTSTRRRETKLRRYSDKEVPEGGASLPFWRPRSSPNRRPGKTWTRDARDHR